MSRFSTVFISLLAMALISSGFAQDETVDWEKFSEGLVWGLTSGNDGLERSSMRLIIKYADKLDVNQVASNIYSILISHENPKVRQLALVALHKMNNVWQLNNLVDDIYTETDPIIRHQMATILNEKPILYVLD